MRKPFLPVILLTVVALLAALPVIGSRALVQELFMVLCLLVLALNWNMLAGFAGLVSVGQQAFVGIGAYAMFACVILWGMDPLAGLLVGGLVAMALSVPVAFFAFRPGLPPELRLFIVTGFLGGLTTFSSFSAEVVQLIDTARYAWAAGAAALHVLGSLTMTALGMWSVHVLRN